MTKNLSILLFLGIFGTLLLYFLNLGLNDIWNPNEAFYAEGAKEMLENGLVMETPYNFQPRHQKPPMTYWLALTSFKIFGVSEFSARLPIVLSALGTLVLTFLLGFRIRNRQVGLISVIVMALSLQFAANSRYVSPEVPLTFFFTLTLYLFYEAVRQNRRLLFYCSYLALGLTVLTKGFPFFVVIAAIQVAYLVLKGYPRIREIWQSILNSQMLTGFLIALMIGGLWYFYNYQKFGEEFLATQGREVVHRAFSERVFKVSDIFFYLGVIAWGFLPYSLTFYLALIYVLSDASRRKQHLFVLLWFAVIILVFTVARGKIPTYIIPAHPAMSVIVASVIYDWISRGESIFLDSWQRNIFKLSFYLPLIIFVIAGVVISLLFDGGWWLLVALVPLLLLYSRENLILFPFFGQLAGLLLFALLVLPALEAYRPYDQLRNVFVGDKVSQGRQSVLIEGRRVHNLPFYTGRKVVENLSIDTINPRLQSSPQLTALVRSEHLQLYPNVRLRWKGMIYDGGSESRTGRLISNVVLARMEHHPNLLSSRILHWLLSRTLGAQKQKKHKFASFALVQRK